MNRVTAMTSEERKAALQAKVDSILHNDSQLSAYRLPDFVVQTVFFCVLSTLMPLLIYAVILYRRKLGPRAAVAVACFLMYGLATLHWAQGLWTVVMNKQGPGVRESATVQCFHKTSGDESCFIQIKQLSEWPGLRSGSWLYWMVTQDHRLLALTQMMLGNVAVSMLILCLWEGSSAIQVLFVIVFSVTALVTNLSISDTSASRTSPVVNDLSIFAALLFSVLLNVWIAVLLGIISNARERPSRSQSERSQRAISFKLSAAVSVLYCVVCAFFVAADVYVEFPGGTVPPLVTSTRWYLRRATEVFMRSSFVHLMGIYATVLFLLTTFADDDVLRNALAVQLQILPVNEYTPLV